MRIAVRQDSGLGETGRVQRLGPAVRVHQRVGGAQRVALEPPPALGQAEHEVDPARRVQQLDQAQPA
ncbi:MAG: hypothetical protein J0H35_14250, partial [Rhodospirillales bacterium]|nr:hypothetical protein [Rhodospirillales bacterium]